MPILRASGTFTPGGFNEPTFNGSIGDESDATYIDFPHGAGNATVALETAAGDQPDDFSTLALHIRLQVLADPAYEGTGEVFLNTQADGDALTEFAGFSNGAGGGFAFTLPPTVLAGIVELIVPLNLSPWPTITLADVWTALVAGAYLDFNSWNWAEGEDPPTFRVTEAWLQYGAEVTTVVRQFPRDRGGSLTTPRQWPPSKSFRQAGSYPGGTNA